MDYPILYKKDTADFSNLGATIIQKASNLFVREVLNGEYTAEFDIPSDDDVLKLAEYDDFVKISGQLFRIRSISYTRREDGASVAHLICYHVWYEACDCKYIHHAFTQSGDSEIDGWIGVTPRWVMETIFEDTPFFVGSVEIDTPTDIFATKSNPAAIMAQLIKKVGGEMERDNYTVHLRLGGSQYNGKRIVYGKNLKSIEKKMDDSAIVTRLYPLGMDDMDISSVNDGVAYLDSPLINSYGCVKCGYENFTDISDPQQLLEEAEKLWSNDEEDGIDKPKVEYTVKTPDLKNIRMGDTVRIADTEMNIDILAKVVETEIYPLEPNRGSVVLSNHKDARVSVSDKIVEQIAEITKITDKNGNIMSQYIDNVREKTQSEVEEAVSKRLTVHQFGDMWVDNTENPRKAMVISDGVFAVANSKKPNGDWDWRTIGTADLFTAESINADWLNAGYINTDKITVRSTDGNACLTGKNFTITTPDGFEAVMSADEGFKYIYSRDSYGNPYDYTVFNHEGQKRYWHGHLIPSTYQFAKGITICNFGTPAQMGIIKLEGAAWKEIAALYNKLLNDTTLTNYQKKQLADQMVKCSVTPTRILNPVSNNGAVVIDNMFINKTIGTYSVPVIHEISKEGTYIQLSYADTQYLAYDGAVMLYYGIGGYQRSSDAAPNRCFGVEAVYDIAVTLDVDYK